MPFRVKILGSNSATPAYNRHHTSQILNIQDRHFLIDCGEATQIQLLRYKEKANRINHIFISHLHGDHFLGLFGLLSTMHLFGRKRDITIYGPRGLENIITVQLKHSNSVWNYTAHFHELNTTESVKIFEDDKLTVSTIPLDHRIECCGFLFQEKQHPVRIDKEKLPKGLTHRQIQELKKGNDIVDESGKVLYKKEDLTLPDYKQRSYAYCSDTGYYEPVIPIIKGVDLLYHESTFLKEMEPRARDTFHSTTIDAANIASKSEVKRLLLGHFSSRYKDITPFVEEAREVFPNTELAIEGNTYEIKKT